MKTVLAFDVFGTLIDTAGVVSRLRGLIGERAGDFSRTWREKQLEYTFRRGLMRQYENFAACTRESLDYTAALFGDELTNSDKESLLRAYRTLPAFDDVHGSLAGIRDDNLAMYAFSNGTSEAVECLLNNAGIRDYFIDVVSVDEVATYKPNPDVYRHFLKRTAASGEATWLVSGNPFDVIGAMSAGLRGAWVKRSANAIFDPWGIEPTIEIGSLAELGKRLSEFRPTD